MSHKETFGLGAHADVPVTSQEDEAFAALVRGPAVAPASPELVKTYAQLLLDRQKNHQGCHFPQSAKP